MAKQWEKILSEALQLQGVHINSALVSAQVRKRIYWTNIRTFQTNFLELPETAIPQPRDRGLLLRDIIDEDVPERFYLKDKTVAALLKHKERNKNNGGHFGAKFNSIDGKMSAVTVKGKGMYDLICVAQRGRDPENPTSRKQCKQTVQMLEPRFDGKTNCLTTVTKDNLILQRPRGNNHGNVFADKAPTLTSNAYQHNNYVMTVKQLNPSKESNGVQPYQQNRVYDINGKAPALMNEHAGRTINVCQGWRIRRTTPAECARLQTVPDWYKWKVSETQQYRMLGNGWTVEVIKHIFSFLPERLKHEETCTE